LIAALAIVIALPCICPGHFDEAAAAPAEKEKQKISVSESAKAEAAKPAEVPVIFNGKPLFQLRARILSFSPEERARLVEERLRKLARSVFVETGSITAVDSETTSEIVAGDLVIMAVTNDDAAAAGRARLELAKDYVTIIRDAIDEQRSEYSIKTLSTGVAMAVGLTVLFVLFHIILKKIFNKAAGKLDSWRGVHIPAVKIQKLELISSDRITDALIRAAGWLRILLVIIAFYFYIILLLTFFPWTRPISTKIFGYIVTPLGMIGSSVVSYLPNLFFLSVIVVVTYYGLKLVRFFFASIERGIITFPGFYQEWALPTYDIVRFMVIAFAAVVAFPYLPGSDSPAFKGVSIFVGVLLSLGSTAAVANAVAGIILTYMRAFRVGDRVKISDTTGDVVEKSLLVTRVRTIKNEDITIPNAMILGSHIVNYSSVVNEKGLILHTGVTIGYDAPWRKVHERLIAAAGNTAHIMKDPAPFVLQTGLDDFYVSYELNAYTDQPSRMASIYSELHQNIQDSFNEAGIEIMSPHYSSLRDGNRTTIPEAHLPETYTAPGFRISSARPGTDKPDRQNGEG
jgi:small-conductance mechanosensitive channel